MRRGAAGRFRRRPFGRTRTLADVFAGVPADAYFFSTSSGSIPGAAGTPAVGATEWAAVRRLRRRRASSQVATALSDMLIPM
ncbi:hypothetical protein [Actinomadura sp. CNU-125]|uniref:hypothetical protein n=1 Tax=Actinomadura sp. CNU-125 TaxID=1904961 RepID=UPI002916F810|nr:hypothetical protein [Actinomadura sp. CNU-125]